MFQCTKNIKNDVTVKKFSDNSDFDKVIVFSEKQYGSIEIIIMTDTEEKEIELVPVDIYLHITLVEILPFRLFTLGTW